MKTIVNVAITLFLFMHSSVITAQQSDTQELKVSVTNISSAQGTIMVGLYNTEDQFLRKPFKSLSIKAKKGIVQVVFTDIPMGTYAISAYHDEDDNNKLNTNFIGIPKEPYGASNDAKNMFGPPRWKDAKFSITDSENTQVIKF